MQVKQPSMLSVAELIQFLHLETKEDTHNEENL